MGIASVEDKAEENDILWHDEAVVGRILYPTGFYSNQFSYWTRINGRRPESRLRTLT
ncbi:MAG: hypothetical protein ABIM42_06750 [candidate division WOR-3 bacterium]